jgi:hypothetical protein
MPEFYSQKRKKTRTSSSNSFSLLWYDRPNSERRFGSNLNRNVDNALVEKWPLIPVCNGL